MQLEQIDPTPQCGLCTVADGLYWDKNYNYSAMPLVYGCGIYSDSDNLPHGSSLDDTVAANPRLRQLTGYGFYLRLSVCLSVFLQDIS